MLTRLMHKCLGVDVSTASGRALIEERYWSLRRQVPIIYVLGLVNLSAMEVAANRPLSIGFNLPTFILVCAIIRIRDWFGRGSGKQATYRTMVNRMAQTVIFAAAVCLAVCARCLYLLQVGDTASHMAVILFGGLTAIGVAYATALENVELPLLYRGESRRIRHEQGMAALEKVGLADWSHHKPSELSGGQQQRVAIARALVTEPDVLLADEPTGNLDSERSVEIMELLSELNSKSGLTVLLVTHEADMAAYARKIVHFKDGLVDQLEEFHPSSATRLSS